MWGFCNQWIWDCPAKFLEEGGYITDCRLSVLSDKCMHKVEALVSLLGWPRNKKAKLCHIYIIAKAKSLWSGKGWLWRPIAASASPQPIVLKSKVRVAARAFTRLLQYLVHKIPMSFPFLSVTEMSN